LTQSTSFLKGPPNWNRLYH